MKDSKAAFHRVTSEQLLLRSLDFEGTLRLTDHGSSVIYRSSGPQELSSQAGQNVGWEITRIAH